MGAMREIYQRHRNIDQASDPTDELAIMRTAVERGVERAMKGDSPAFRQEALAAFEALDLAVRGGDPAALVAALQRLGGILRAGRDHDAALAEVFAQAERTAGRATDFRRTRIQEMRVWTEVQVLALLRTVSETVRENAPIQIAIGIESALDRRLALAQGLSARAGS
jgi:hypothetical protein